MLDGQSPPNTPTFFLFLREFQKSPACFSIGKTIQSIQMNAETLRLLLAGLLAAMVVLAIVYLRHQPLTFSQYPLWGLSAQPFPSNRQEVIP